MSRGLRAACRVVMTQRGVLRKLITAVALVVFVPVLYAAVKIRYSRPGEWHATRRRLRRAWPARLRLVRRIAAAAMALMALNFALIAFAAAVQHKWVSMVLYALTAGCWALPRQRSPGLRWRTWRTMRKVRRAHWTGY